MDESTLLKQAVAAARAGRKAEARQLLEHILQANPRHEQAWLWMGAVVETDAERVECLQQVLAINPDNAAAREGLAQLQARVGAAPATPQPAIPATVRCPHCGAANRAGAGFCSGCGQTLEVAAPPSQPPSVPSQKARARPEGRRKPKPAQSRWGLCIAGIALLGLMALGVCGVGGWLVYQRLAKMAGGSVAGPVARFTPTPAATSPAAVAPTSSSDATPTEAAASGYLLFAVANESLPSNSVMWDIYVSDINGESRKLLGSSTYYHPKGGFSPNGQWLYFITDDQSESTLYVADADGSNLHSVLSRGSYGFSSVIFSNDGWVMLFGRGYSDLVYNRRTDRLTDLTGYCLLQLSADGRWVLLKNRPDGQSGVLTSYSLLNTDTGRWQTLGEFWRASMSLALDGSRVLISSSSGAGDASCNQVQTYDIARDHWSKLYSEREVTHIRFLPDSRHVLWHGCDRGELDIYRVNAETGEQSAYFSGSYD